MEIIFEILFKFIAELLIQAVLEFLAEIGSRFLEGRLKRPRNPLYATVGFIIVGAIVGGVSLLILPFSLIDEPFFRNINLFLTPVLLGFMMTLIGKLRQKKGQDLVRIDRFGYAFAFAFAMGLVRFVWAA